MPDFVAVALAEHVKRYPPGPDGLVFTAPKGGPIRRPAFYRLVWSKATEATGLDGFPFRNLRHTGATLALQEGTNPILVAFRLGHASTAMIERHYGGERVSRALGLHTCDATRRPAGMAPSDHPASIYLREDRASDKVTRFLRERVFGPERIPLLREALAGTDPQTDERRDEVERLRAEIDGLTVRIRRQVANLETEEPGTDVAKEIRRRLEELTSLKAKRQQQLEAAERAAAERPNPEQAAELLDVLPLFDVDFERLEDAEFRALLDALNFEARYDPRSQELAVRVVLAPELVGPNDGQARSPLLLVPPARTGRKGRRPWTPLVQVDATYPLGA